MTIGRTVIAFPQTFLLNSDRAPESRYIPHKDFKIHCSGTNEKSKTEREIQRHERRGGLLVDNMSSLLCVNKQESLQGVWKLWPYEPLCNRGICTAIIELQVLSVVYKSYLKYKTIFMEDVKIKTRETPVNIILCKYCFSCF